MTGITVRFKAVLSGVALLCAATTVIRAADPTAVDAPEGWKRTRTTAGVAIYQPEGLAQGEDARIVIFPGDDVGGDFRAWFDATRAGLEEGERVSGGGRVEASKSKTGADLLTADVVTNSKKHGFLLRRYVAANNGGKGEIILYRASGAGLFETHEPTFREMSLAWRDAWAGLPAVARKKAPPKDEIPEADVAPEADPAAPVAEAPAAEAEAPIAGAAGAIVEKVPATPRKPGWVVGSVTNMYGKPAKDVQFAVTIGGVTLTGGQRTSFTPTVKPDGTFAQRVPEGLYAVRCDAIVDYQGRQFRIPLDAQDGEPRDEKTESSIGIVKDFRLRIQGLKNGGNKAKLEDHYGAAIGLHNGFKNAHAGATIEVTLTPRGPLLDGTTGQPQTLKFDIDSVLGPGHRSRYYQNIALGCYTVSAVITEASGARARLNLEPELNLGNGRETIDIIMETGKYLSLYVSE